MKYACRIPALTYENEKWQIFAATVAVAILVAEAMIKKIIYRSIKGTGKTKARSVGRTQSGK